MRPVLAVVFLAVLRVPSAAVAEDFGGIERASIFTQRGSRALQAGNLRKAETQFAKALSVSSSFPDAHLGLGQVAMRERRFAEALERFGAAHEGYERQGDALVKLQAERYVESRKQIEQLRTTIQQIRVVHERTRGRSGQGAPHERQRATIIRLENAIANLEAVRPPDRSTADDVPGEVFFYIGNALLNLGRLDEAIASWETCSAKAPDFAPVHLNLAVGYWQRGRLQDARSSLARSTELGVPGNPQFREELEASPVAR